MCLNNCRAINSDQDTCYGCRLAVKDLKNKIGARKGYGVNGIIFVVVVFNMEQIHWSMFRDGKYSQRK